jgi:hypothetical protein
LSSYAEFYIDQGATFSTTITLDDDATGSRLNVVGYTAESQMKRSYYSANASANLICTFTDSANGELTLSLPSGNTSNLTPNKYLFDVKITSGSNTVTRILEGVIVVTPQISKG